MTATIPVNRIARFLGTPARRKGQARRRGVRPGLERMESRRLLSGTGYSEGINFDGLTFAVVGSVTSGPRFHEAIEDGQEVLTVTGATVAVGPEVDGTDFPGDFKPVLYLNGDPEAGPASSSASVTLFRGTAATEGTTGNQHGEFTTDGDIEGYYAGGYHAIVGSGQTNILYAGELTASGGDTLTNAGGVTIGFDGIAFTASNLGIDTANTTLTMQGSFSVDALQSNTTHLAGTAAVSIDAAGQVGINSLSGSISMGSGQTATLGGLTLSDGALAVAYDGATQEIDLAGSVTIQQENAADNPAGPKLTVSLGELNANNTIETPGIAISGDSLVSLNGSVSSTATFKAAGITFAPENLSVSYQAGPPSSLVIDGQAKLTWGSNNSVGVQLGNATNGTNGLVLEDGKIAALSGSIDANFSLMGLTFRAQQLTVGYVAASQDLTIYGGTSVTNNSSSNTVFNNLSAQLGGSAAPGIVVQDGVLQNLNIAVSGSFQLYGVRLAADGLNVVYVASQDNLQLAGRVDVVLTNAIQGTVALPNGGVTINTTTGAFAVNGLALAFNASISSFRLNVDIQYQASGSGYSLDASAGVTLPGAGAVINGRLVIVNDTLQDIALSYNANGGSGIPLGQSQVYLTQIGGELDNLNNAANFKASLTAAIAVGSTLTVGSTKYSLLTATGTLVVTPNYLSLSGSVSVVSAGSTALLGSGSGSVMLNWQQSVYTASASLSLYNGAFNVSGQFTLSGNGNLTLYATASVNIPSSVPWVGGKSFGEANFYLQVQPGSDPSDTYAKAWVSTIIGTVGIEYNLGTGFDWFRGDPGVPAPATQSGSQYTSTFTVAANQVDATVTIGDLNFQTSAQTLSKSTINLVYQVGSFPIPLARVSLGTAMSSSGGSIAVNQAEGTISFSARSLISSLSPEAPLPAGTYEVVLVTPSALTQAPTIQVDSAYLPPTLGVGQPVLTALPANGGEFSTATIPLTATSYDPNAQLGASPTTISLYAATAANAGTADNDDAGELIASIPYYLVGSVDGSKVDLASGTLSLPDGYVTYQNDHPVSFTWTSFLVSAPASDAAVTLYVYGEIDDGANVPVRSAQTWAVQPSNPTPQLGAVAPITTNFSQSIALPTPTLTDPGQWPLVITVVDNGGYAALSGKGITSATTLTFRTGTSSNPVQAALQFLQGVSYELPSSATDFPGYDSVTITATAQVGPLLVPYTTQEAIDLSEPNADLVVAQGPSLFPAPSSNQIYWTVTVTNQEVAGAEPATNVVVADTLPPGVTAQVADGSQFQGTFDPATGTWDVGDLAVGQTETLVLLLTLPPGQTLSDGFYNTLVATSDQPDLYPDDAVNVTRLHNPSAIITTL